MKAKGRKMTVPHKIIRITRRRRNPLPTIKKILTSLDGLESTWIISGQNEAI